MTAQATPLYPFVPSGPDFETAIAFFGELGFEKQWEHDGYAGLRFGGAYFVLQRIDVPDWQKNQMIVYEVDDLAGYWSDIDAKDLSARFPSARTRPPTDFHGAAKSTSSIPPGCAGMCDSASHKYSRK